MKLVHLYAKFALKGVRIYTLRRNRGMNIRICSYMYFLCRVLCTFKRALIKLRKRDSVLILTIDFKTMCVDPSVPESRVHVDVPLTPPGIT